jgi:outer membrane lipoprotein carrier protein
MSLLGLLTFVLVSVPHALHAPARAGRVVASSSSRTSPRIKVGAVLERLQRRYEGASDFRAHVEQSLVGPLFKSRTVQNGMVLFKKPGSMRWEFQEPATQWYVSDGTTLWLYQPENKEIYRQDLKNSQLPSALAFLAGRDSLTAEFDVKLAGKTPYGRPGDYVLSLVRKNPQRTVKSVLLVVDPVTFDVRESVVIDAVGSVNDMILSDIKVNTGIPDGTFHFAPPAGAHVTDLSKPPQP